MISPAPSLFEQIIGETIVTLEAETTFSSEHIRRLRVLVQTEALTSAPSITEALAEESGPSDEGS